MAALLGLGKSPAGGLSDDQSDLNLTADATASLRGIGGSSPDHVLLPAVQPTHDEFRALLDSEAFRRSAAQDPVQREQDAPAAAQETNRLKVVAPTTGRITSNYGPRWGSTHYGLDIANELRTPVRAAAAGVVVEAGPASGFGLWVRIRLDDGRTLVYGHIDSYSIRAGQRVRAGDEIAKMGNRGISTGSHLHFEVWDPSGRKVDPLAWLHERGVNIG